MPVSVREQLLSAITTAVGGEYALEVPEDEDDVPVTIVEEGEDAAENDQYGITNIEMPVAIAKAAAAAPQASRALLRAQANELLAQIITAMFSDETFTGLADGVQYTGGGILTEIGKLVFAEAQFTVRYHHVRGDPYTIDEP